MASVNSPIRKFIKPLLFRLLGKRGYKYAQFYGKMRDINHRLVEEKEMELLPLILKPGDSVFDVGANYAYYTDRFSQLVGDTGTVYAFEPIPFTFGVSEMIVKKRRLRNVKLYNLGVGDKNQQLMFTVPRLGFGGISAGQAHISGRRHESGDKKTYYDFDTEEQVACNVVALDDFIGDAITRLSFIKIDIEGAEWYALRGMEQLIARFSPVILIEVQPYFLRGFHIDEQEFRSYLEDTLGYTIFHYDPSDGKLHRLDGSFFDANFILINHEKLERFQSLLAK
jgi:FkbM family methyltransferase